LTPKSGLKTLVGDGGVAACGKTDVGHKPIRKL